MVSGSNCCDPETIHLFLRTADGSFAARQEIKFDRPGLSPFHDLLLRGRSRPHLLDWNRDGQTDLVIAYLGRRDLLVSAGPLGGKTEVAVEPFALPTIPDEAHPSEFRFADWDGDGVFDLLLTAQYREVNSGARLTGLYWFRNTSAEGEPTFAAASQLLSLPAPWQSSGFAVSDRDDDARPELVMGVYKDWKRKDGVWSGDSQLWLYRRSTK